MSRVSKFVMGLNNRGIGVADATTTKPNHRAVSVVFCFIASLISGCASVSGPALDAQATPSANGTQPEQVTAWADYRIGPEDRLDISVWKEPDLQQTVTVQPDGDISFPLVGNITAAGLTTAELRAEVTTRLSDFIPEAVVNVTIVELQGLKVFVTGKVKSPGQYRIGRYVDVLQAIALAGGLTTFADGKNVRIIRRVGSQESIYRFNYSQVQRGRDLDQNILLQPGDTVVVP